MAGGEFNGSVGVQKSVKAERSGLVNPQSRRQREDVTALGMTRKVGPAWGHRPRLGTRSRSLQTPFPVTQ